MEASAHDDRIFDDEGDGFQQVIRIEELSADFGGGFLGLFEN